MSTNIVTNPQQTAVIYARVSSEEQVQGYSIQAQLRACREWAEKHGYMIARNISMKVTPHFVVWKNAKRSKNCSRTAALKSEPLIPSSFISSIAFRDTLESSTARGNPQARAGAADLRDRTDGRLRYAGRFLHGTSHRSAWRSFILAIFPVKS